MPCSYAYSVDDAQGNVQAEGRGFILDISSTVNLENSHQCSPPINIALGYDPNVTPRFYKYAVCKITDKVANDRVKPVIPGFASFVISAQNPAECPIYLWDNVISGKGTSNPVLDTNPSGPPLGQMYTFRINGDTTLFPLFTPPFTTAIPLPPGAEQITRSSDARAIRLPRTRAKSGAATRRPVLECLFSQSPS